MLNGSFKVQPLPPKPDPCNTLYRITCRSQAVSMYYMYLLRGLHNQPIASLARSAQHAQSVSILNCLPAIGYTCQSGVSV